MRRAVDGGCETGKKEEKIGGFFFYDVLVGLLMKVPVSFTAQESVAVACQLDQAKNS